MDIWQFWLHTQTSLTSIVFAAMATCGVGMSSEQLAEVLRTVKDGMREEISAFKRELSQERDATDEQLLKKMRLEKAPSFRKKTHKKQYQFNEEIACKLDAASAVLKEAPPTLKKARPRWKKVRNLCVRDRI